MNNIPGSVCVIGTYFGKLPKSFEIWLKSCEWNPSIHFLLFIDQKIERHPKNVTCVDFTFEKFRETADKKLGFKTCLDRPYKMCDFKPAYGLIFEEYITEYEYWGFCDFDLVWGDIRWFIEKYEYRKYDKFLPMGHFMLYRNTYECNRRFMLDGSLVGDYKSVFTTPNNVLFDEILGMSAIYRKHGFPEFCGNIYADIDVYHRRMIVFEQSTLNNKGAYAPYYKEKGHNAKNQVFCWNKGKALRFYYEKSQLKSEEYIYIHLQKRKMSVEVSADSETIFILSDLYLNGSLGDVTMKNVKKLNRYKGAAYEFGEGIFYFVKQRLINKCKSGNRVIFVSNKD